jgi:hypothetical protein
MSTGDSAHAKTNSAWKIYSVQGIFLRTLTNGNMQARVGHRIFLGVPVSRAAELKGKRKTAASL